MHLSPYPQKVAGGCPFRDGVPVKRFSASVAFSESCSFHGGLVRGNRLSYTLINTSDFASWQGVTHYSKLYVNAGK